MLPVCIDQAGSDSSIEVWTMAGHTDLGINFLPALEVTGVGKHGEKEAYQKKREGM